MGSEKKKREKPNFDLIWFIKITAVSFLYSFQIAGIEFIRERLKIASVKAKANFGKVIWVEAEMEKNLKKTEKKVLSESKKDMKRICKRCRFGCSAFYIETPYCRHQKAEPVFNYVTGKWRYDTCEFARDRCKGDWFEKWNLFRKIFCFFFKKEKLVPQNKTKKQLGFRTEEKGDSK